MTEQSNSAAERSAHVTRGAAEKTVESIVVEVSPGVFVLRAVHELRQAAMREQEEICQILGKALRYPWFKDDQKNFPGATEGDGVCVGDHVAVTLAMEAANRIAELEAIIAEGGG